MTSIDDQIAAEGAVNWNPHKEDHDPLGKGEIIFRDTFHGDYGDSAILVIDRGDDSPDAKPPGRFIKWFAFGTVADGEIQEKDPQPGQQVAILYKGTDTVKAGANKGKPYPLWRVFVDGVAKPPPEPDVPIDGGDLPEPPKPGSQFGDETPF